MFKPNKINDNGGDLLQVAVMRIASLASGIGSAAGTYEYCINHDYHIAIAVGLSSGLGVMIYGMAQNLFSQPKWGHKLFSGAVLSAAIFISGHTLLENAKAPELKKYNQKVEEERLRINGINKERESNSSTLSDVKTTSITQQLNANNQQVTQLNKANTQLNSAISQQQKNIKKGIRPKESARQIKSLDRQISTNKIEISHLNKNNRALLTTLTVDENNNTTSTEIAQTFKKPIATQYDVIRAYLLDIFTVLFIYLESMVISKRRRKQAVIVNDIQQATDKARQQNTLLSINTKKNAEENEKYNQLLKSLLQNKVTLEDKEMILTTLLEQSSTSIKALADINTSSAAHHSELTQLLDRQMEISHEYIHAKSKFSDLVKTSQDETLQTIEYKITGLEKSYKTLSANLDKKGQAGCEIINHQYKKVIKNINEKQTAANESLNKAYQQSVDQSKHIDHQAANLRKTLKTTRQVLNAAHDFNGTTGARQGHDRVTTGARHFKHDICAVPSAKKSAVTQNSEKMQDNTENNLTELESQLMPASDNNFITVDGIMTYFGLSKPKSKALQLLAYEAGFLEKTWCTSGNGYYTYSYPRHENNVYKIK